jgi:hypothetical protein
MISTVLHFHNSTLPQFKQLMPLVLSLLWIRTIIELNNSTPQQFNTSTPPQLHNPQFNTSSTPQLHTRKECPPKANEYKDEVIKR